eukprot:GHVO01018237.1.p1 GENE.GHVO01018237.1~~GHVO01018237.1.p1  ORF type:complete len:420 (+),score=101.20 GHVO01018237.1:213-1472(+)
MVDREGPKMRLADFYPRNLTEIFTDMYHGAYSVLGKDDIFYTASGNRIEAYYDPQGTETIVKMPEEMVLPDGRTPKQDVIRALCMTWDGHLIFVTAGGRVGAVKSDHLDTPIDIIDLGLPLEPPLNAPDASGAPLEISNNIACDEDGGVYIVAPSHVHKVQWSQQSQSLSILWSTPYLSDEISTGVRLGQGSGSTPSLMGDSDTGRYVVITDGRALMHVVVMDGDTGEYIDDHPVTFGDPLAVATASEQSVLVLDWKFAVVNNTPKTSSGNALFGYESVPQALTGGDGDSPIAKAWPVLTGQAPQGIEQFEYNPLTRKIRRSWVNSEVSIPNGIPTVSAASNLIYGVGRRKVGGVYRRFGPTRSSWTIEALDWLTGASRFYYGVGSSILRNSIYAATQIGNREVLSGTGGGIIRLKATC